jgi:hypothetical protein
MANPLEKLKDTLQKPLVKRITDALLPDIVGRIKARIGEDPVIAFGGLATFLAWLAGKLPAKLKAPVQGVVALLGVLGAKAAVTPAANPKVVLVVPLEPIAAPIVPAGAMPSLVAPAAKPAPGTPVVKVTVPLAPPPRDKIQDAVAGAVGKLLGKPLVGAR